MPFSGVWYCSHLHDRFVSDGEFKSGIPASEEVFECHRLAGYFVRKRRPMLAAKGMCSLPLTLEKLQFVVTGSGKGEADEKR